MGTIIVDYTPQALADLIRLPAGSLPIRFEFDEQRDCWHVGIDDPNSGPDEKCHAHIVITKHKDGGETRQLMRRF